MKTVTENAQAKVNPARGSLERLVGLVAHVVYWGIGIPAVLGVGILIFVLASVVVSALKQALDILIGFGIALGLAVIATVVLFLWIWAGLKAGYLKNGE